MSATDNEAQEDELTALESIFDPSVVFIDRSSRFAQGFLSTEPFESRKTSVKIKGIELKVDYLPPVCLRFRFVDGYPDKIAPIFDLRCCWLPLSEIDKLKTDSLNIFNDNLGSPILFLWIHHVQDSIASFLDGSEAIDVYEMESTPRPISTDQQHCAVIDSPCSSRRDCDNSSFSGEFSTGAKSLPNPGPLFRRYSPDRLAKLLRDYDSEAKRRRFESSDYSCDVCFADFMGRNGIAFEPCGHAFCRDCARGYFDLQIKEGSVHALKCMADKCESTAQQYQVKSIVDETTFARYDRLLLSRGLDSMTDVVQCPRPTCRAPVILEPNDGTLGMCGACDMTFCIHCNATYHGIAPCKIGKERIKELMREYESASSEDRVSMEQRYGRERLHRLQEEVAAEAWITENAKLCPNCNAKVEKIEGCNKMTCYRCGGYFCWLCDAVIKSSNPYDHFNSQGGRCYNRLFEGVDDEGDWF